MSDVPSDRQPELTRSRSPAERLRGAGGDLTRMDEEDRFLGTASLPVSTATPTAASPSAPANGEVG